MAKISISVLFYGRPDITKNFLKMLKDTLHDRNDVELLFLDNGCIDHGETTRLVFDSGLKNIAYTPLGKNLGFGPGHNFLLEQAKGEFFCVLNNDMFFTDTKWINRLIYPLEENPDLKLVGLEDVPSILNLQPDGYVAGIRGNRVDYIEGSCLVGRVKDFKKYGLFDPIYEKGLFEDGDLSMRFKQMGLLTSVVKIPHKHLRAQSLSQLSPHERMRTSRKNCEIFKKRWSFYIMNKQFANRINIEIESLGIGDVLARTPLIEALRKNHPTAILEVTTSHPAVFMANPHLTHVYEMKREFPNPYDRNLKTSPNYASYRLISEESAAQCALELEDHRPQIYLSRLEVEEAGILVDSLKEDENDVVIGVQLQNDRWNWHGKTYPRSHVIELIQMIQETGAKVIELGKNVESSGVADMDLVDKLELRELFAVMANVSLFVGIDSLCSHVARAFSIPSFVLYGATHPLAYTVSWIHEFPIFREDLLCVGCYQAKSIPNLNQCNLRFQECMEGLKPDYIMKFITMSREKLLERNIQLLEKYRREELWQKTK